MNNKITYRKEGDYLIPNLYIKDYKKVIIESESMVV